MKVRHLLYILAITILFACHTRKENNTGRPNVLLIYMDDLRPQLGCYGNSQMHSPNIDKLASEGIMFTEAYCNIPVCGASRASMLTGMYPTKNRFINYNTFAEKEVPEAVSFPKLFKLNGYTTISNGKIYHHLDDNMSDWDEVWRPYAFEPNDKGLSPTDYWQSLWKDYQLPENHKEYVTTGTGPAFEKADVNDTAYIDGLMAQKVIRDIKKLKKAGKPFLLTAGFISNHLPFNAPARHWEKYPHDKIKQPYNNFVPENAPRAAIDNWPEMRAYSGIPKHGQVSNDTAKLLIHGYYATVSYVDALIGKILDALKNEGLEQNTIVMLVADHGYNLQEHTLWAKYTSFRITSRVPLIMKVPGVNGGKKSSSLVELVDVYPTITELCNLKAPRGQLEGKSFVPVLINPKTKINNFVFTKTANAFMLTTPEYGYTEFIDLKTGKPYAKMLYDHCQDPDENVNVIDNPEYTSVAKKLGNILHTRFNSNINGK
ncbi:MAG: sulfatase [Chlorobi bacterium]|nr:sulfatase [Chlorobiota bacterium]